MFDFAETVWLFQCLSTSILKVCTSTCRKVTASFDGTILKIYFVFPATDAVSNTIELRQNMPNSDPPEMPETKSTYSEVDIEVNASQTFGYICKLNTAAVELRTEKIQQRHNTYIVKKPEYTTGTLKRIASL